MSRSIKISLALVLLVSICVAFVHAPQGRYKNLQILPKDIAPRMLDSIMDSYSKALGIGCSFCHVAHASIPDSLDYASDKNEMKENARGMMKLTIDINTKYFYYDTTVPPVYLNIVRCQTCHRGEPYPVE